MRYLPFLVLACGVSAHAILPNPTTDSLATKPNTSTLSTMPTLSTTTLVAPNVSGQVVNQVANDKADFITVVNAFVVKTQNGIETLIPVSVGTPVKSGDVLEYQGLFTNTGDRVRKMDVTLSIADGLELVGGVSPQYVNASIDGSRFVRMPIRVKVGGEIQNLPLSQYKALRWTIDDVGLGGTAVVKYRAKVK